MKSNIREIIRYIDDTTLEKSNDKLVFYAERHYQTMSNVIFQALDILYAREEQQNNKE